MTLRSSFVRFLVPVALTGCVIACSAPESDGDGEADGDRDPGSGGSNNDFDIDGSGGSGLPPAMIETTLPAGFIANTAVPEKWECEKLPGGNCNTPAGGYQRVGAVSDTALETENSCRNVLRGIVRDFDESHADFGGDPDGADGLNLGQVVPTLDENRKPTAAAGATQMQMFGDWFTNDAGGNVPYVVDFWLQPQGNLFVFDSYRFFPVDGVGTNSGNGRDNQPHNFGFTTELHTAFQYKGGETFTFSGDDDVFIYINNVLAVDLGGVHSAYGQSVDIDTFAATNGMTIGEVYNLDLFHAERNPTGSNFRIETSLDFKECGILESDIVVR